MGGAEQSLEVVGGNTVGYRQQREDLTAVVVDAHRDQVQSEPGRGGEAAQIVEQGQVAGVEGHGPGRFGRSDAQGGGGGTVDAGRAPVGAAHD